jgi:hypothetical protein
LAQRTKRRVESSRRHSDSAKPIVPRPRALGEDGFPPGDKFEGFGHSAEDKPERENPDVNIPPSAHEPYKSLKRFKLVDEFADGEINASFGKTVDVSATNNRSRTEGAWQLAGNLKMPGMAIHRDTWNNTSNQCSIFPFLA